MKIQYVANDGKIFEEEEDCLDYENQKICDKDFKGCLFYDGSKRKIVLNNKNVEDVWYAHFETKEQLEKFIKLSDNLNLNTYGLEDINNAFPLDFYYKEECLGEFKQYDFSINDLLEKINSLNLEKYNLFYNKDN